ncbi:MAG: hypothetical protein DRI90_26710, partial [Deltaproteobacteria bacterium]
MRRRLNGALAQWPPWPWPSWGRLLLITLLVLWATACLPPQAADQPDYLGQARRAAADSKNPERVAAWLLAELLMPGGDQKQADRARRRLSGLDGKGALSGLVQGIDHDNHGRFREAATAYLV